MNPASVERKEIIGLHRITKKVLRNLCKKHQLYQTPELNDVLYLHYQGFQYIECLEEYTELKCLWLECNAISEIQGLENQTKLKCLFLQNNLIKSIENLEHCRELDTLNLASNHIRKIDNCGVDILPVLNTLNLSSNCLRDSESLRGLEECKTLSVLDLANNRIDDILVVKVFAKMPQLRVLVLQGNPVVSKIPQYRKTLILECKELTYLDSRPVFPKDRACAEAWKRGGYNEERKEQERWNRRDRKKIRDSVNATIRMRNKHKPIDEQMDLITSSDSETDEKRRKEAKERREHSTDPRLLLETGEDIDAEETLLDIWDEVSGPDGIVKKVENETEEEETVEEEAIIITESTNNAELNVMETLEIPERVNVADILKMVENPMTDNKEAADLPELVSDVDTRVQRKRSLVEEISDAPNKVCKTLLGESESNGALLKDADLVEEQENSEITAPVAISTDNKKRLFIEEVSDETQPPPSYDKLSDCKNNDLLPTLTAKEEKNQLLDLSEKYIESDDKKPLWVDEIFSQSFVSKSTQNLQEQQAEDTLISHEIEKEIKQGAIKKRRPFIESKTCANIDDFFKPIEKAQLAGEFDLNFDELDAPEPESTDISDFEDVQNDPSFEQFSKSLLGKSRINENKQAEYLEFEDNSQSFFKLLPKVVETNTKSSNKQALLIEEIANDDHQTEEQSIVDFLDKTNEIVVSTERDIKTNMLHNSLIEEIGEDIQSCDTTTTNSNEACILTGDLRENSLNIDVMTESSKLTESKVNKECSDFDNLDFSAVTNQQQSNNLESLQELLEQPQLLERSVVEPLVDGPLETTYPLSIDNVSIEKVLKESMPEIYQEASIRPKDLHTANLLENSHSNYNDLVSKQLEKPPLFETLEDKLETTVALNLNIVDGEKVDKAAIPVNYQESTALLKSFKADSLSETEQDSDSELSNASDDLCSDTSSDLSNSKYDTSKPILETTQKCALNLDYNESTSSESEDEMIKSQYNEAANAICEAVMSRVGAHEQPMPEKKYYMPTKESTEMSAENYEPELEMEKILERLPDDEATERAKRLEPNDEVIVEEVIIKTAAEIKYDVECEEVNRQVTQDFEALNANMEYFIDQLQQEQEQIKGEYNTKIEELKFQVMEKVDQKDQKEGTIFEKIVQTENITFQQRKANDDVQFNFIYDEEATTGLILQPTVVGNDEINDGLLIYETTANVQAKSSQMDCINELTAKMAQFNTQDDEVIRLDGKPLEDNQTAYPGEAIITTTITKLESESLEISMENTDLVKACGDHAGIGQTKEKLPFLELEEMLERPALKAYEQEAIELKALLHKLELQNEKLTFVKKSCDELLMSESQDINTSDDETTEDTYHDAEESLEENTQLVDALISDIVSDVVDKGVEKMQVEKPKNYVITDLESDEEYSYSGPPKPEEPPVKSIQSVLGAFHNLIQDIARKNRAEIQRERMQFESKRVPTTETAKLESLQTLLETPNLLEHHKSSYKELQPQVDAVKQRNTDELKQMVERVYAQKDKYDDSLEVVDGRLVIIKKETGEVEDVVTKKEAYGSDESAEEYESAHSSNEAESEEKVRESKNLIWDFSMGATKPHTWVPKYRPTMRKSAEQLILNAIESNEAANKLNTQSDDAEDATEAEDGAETLRQSDSKSSVFSNIDEAFFKNLDFKKIAEESSKDENFVEVARSYEELKQIIKQSGLETARSTLTDEEQNIVEMFEEDSVEVTTTVDNADNEELTQAEDVLMHKLVQRTKEAKERGDELFNVEIDPTDKAYAIIDEEQIDNAFGDIKHSCESDEETLVDEVVSNKTITFEMEHVECPKNFNVVKMLKKLQIDDPIAVDLLKDKQRNDYGNFTAPLESNFERLSLQDENDIVETAQANYAEKLDVYKKMKMEKQLSVPSSEVAIQCEPSNFETVKGTQNLEIEYQQSTEADLEIKVTSHLAGTDSNTNNEQA